MLPFLLTVNAQEAPQFLFDYLQSTRANITFIPYSLTQKKSLGVAVNALFDIFPHTESKIANYGKDYPNIDPVPRAKAISQNIEQLTDAEIHSQYSQLFLSLRDGHTNYFFPAPHSCYAAFTAARFQFIESNDIINEPRIVVSNFVQTVLPLSPNAKAIEIGDELLTIDGKSFVQVFKEREFKNGGANRFGGYRNVLNQLTARGGKLYPMPIENNVTYTLRSQKSGLDYSVTLPWVTRQNVNCTKEAEPFLITGIPEPSRMVKAGFRTQKVKKPFYLDPLVPEEVSNKIEDSLVYQQTSEPKIKWTIFNPESQNMGVLRIDDFQPATGDAKAVRLIFELLNNQLADTKSLLIDLRSNGGGSPIMATSIHQIFVSGFNGITKRVIISPTVEELVVKLKSQGEDYYRAYIEAPAGSKYSNLVDVLSEEEANSLGQAYLKPVGVFTDANCYSACDVLSTNMKDGEAAVIFGEDGQTGAGGASVFTYSRNLSPVSPLFPPLPFGDKIVIAPDMRVSVLQTLKNGINRGDLVEDNGVFSDYVVRPRLEDILVPSSMSQFDRIASKLEQIGKERGTANRMLLIRPLDEFDSMLGSFVNFKLKTENIHSISIVSEAGEVEYSQTFDTTILKETGVNFVPKSTVAKRETYMFLGFNRNGNNIFKGKRKLRLIPSQLYEIATVDTPILFTEEGVAVYSDRKTANSAWAINNGRAKIGDDQGYADNVNSQISVFTQATGGKRVHLGVKARYMTEKDSDFLTIGYKDAEGSKELIKVSGNGVIDQILSFIPKEGKLEITFQFTSDGALTESGVEIESVSVYQQ